MKEELQGTYPMTIHIRAEFETRKVQINGTYLTPNKSLKVRSHSPDGFAWGYGGSGPAQLALALCIRIFGEDKALKVYNKFKEVHVATLPQTNVDTYIEVKPPEFYLEKSI